MSYFANHGYVVAAPEHQDCPTNCGLLVNAVAPLIAYQILTGNGMPTAQALTASAVFPVISTLWTSQPSTTLQNGLNSR